MKSTEERLKKAALGAGCLFLALGAFEMQSHAADAASQVQSRALLVTRGDYEGTEYDLTPGPQNDGVNVSRMLQNAYGGQNISITTEEKTKTKSELKKAIQTAFADFLQMLPHFRFRRLRYRCYHLGSPDWKVRHLPLPSEDGNGCCLTPSDSEIPDFLFLPVQNLP